MNEINNIKYFDSHAHIFDIPIDSLELVTQDISNIVVPSYNVSNLQTSLDICRTNSKFHCALGIHPQYYYQYDDKVQNFIINHHNDIVAIGEIGLDTRFDNFISQTNILIRQIELAQELSLPIIVHLVGEESYTKFLDIIDKYNVIGVAHCYSNNLENAKKLIDKGFYISFACNITYKRNDTIRKVAQSIPLESILIETDSPSMLPKGFGRSKTNTPANIHYVAEMLAQLKNVSLQDIVDMTADNAKRLFNIHNL